MEDQLRPVALPDLSQASPSVREQIRQAHAALMARIDAAGTPAAERAAAYGEMGRLLMAAEYGQAAEACFLNAQALAPSDMRWPYYLGHLYKELGSNDRSLSSFERARQLRPDDIATLVWLGEAYLSQDRPDAAEPAFATALSLRPRTAAALSGLGRTFLARRDYAGAAKYLQEALALVPQAAAVHYSLAMAYRGLGDLAKAEAHLQQRGKADTVVPDPLMEEVRAMLQSATAFESLGIWALERGDVSGAAGYFRKGIELAPGTASLHHRLGTALLLAGDTRGGQKELETALGLDPDFARAHYSLGVIMVSTGQYQQAVERLSAAVKADPDYVEARLLLGDVLRHGGHPAESLRHYGHVIEIDPGVVEARLGEALALAAMGRYAPARDRLSEASKAHPNQPDIVQALARLLAAAPDANVRDGRRALALVQPVAERQRSPELAETMAMAYAETADYGQAVAWQREAVAAAERAGRDPHVREQMIANLRLFERGEPCRIPWREGTMP